MRRLCFFSNWKPPVRTSEKPDVIELFGRLAERVEPLS
jgi:hypothetical protein